MDKWEVYSTYNMFNKKHNEYTIVSEQQTQVCITYSKEAADQIVREHNSYTIMMDALKHIASISEDNSAKEFAERIISKVLKNQF